MSCLEAIAIRFTSNKLHAYSMQMSRDCTLAEIVSRSRVRNETNASAHPPLIRATERASYCMQLIVETRR
jgi:hypothetical protein